MARLAFAIDAATDIWALTNPTEADAGLADAMVFAIGTDVLIYRNAEMQGGYFGVARLVHIAASRLPGKRELVFDQVRLFTVELIYPAGVTTLTRLQYLDDAEFDAIIRQGEPAMLPLVAMERAGQPFAYDPPALTAIEAVVETVRRDATCCALTGSRDERLEIAVIWPKGVATGLHTNNLLALSPDAYAAFMRGHFTARDDFSIVIDATRMDRALVARVNSTGRLLVPANPGLQPDSENLAFHRRFVFGM